MLSEETSNVESELLHPVTNFHFALGAFFA
jgi:hypothetical protein